MSGSSGGETGGTADERAAEEASAPHGTEASSPTGDASGTGDGCPPDWWSELEVLVRLRGPARPMAERLQRGLFGGERIELPSDAGPAEAWEAVRALRSAVLGGGSRGAPPEDLARLHRRLDEATIEAADALVRRTLADSRELIQDVSHDIRSPLNSILFLADTLFREHAGELNPVQRRQVGVLYTAAVALVGLVNDLIDAGRLGEGTEISVAHVSFSLESVLNELDNLLRPLAQHREITLAFKLETVGPRTGDRQLLSRVLINLVSNALQAAEEGGTVLVSVTEAEEGGLRLEVVDDGPGKDVELLRSLLREPGRGLPTHRRQGWTHGLGLSISSRLVRAAGGSIRVESEEGKGTSFVVTFPFRRI